MTRFAVFIAAALLVPAGAMAARAVPASFAAKQSLIFASSTPGNAYGTGAAVTVTAPVGGDLTAGGGSVVDAAPVSGDALLVGGTISIRSLVKGDVRSVAGHLVLDAPVGGDLAALAYAVDARTLIGGSTLIGAGTANVTGGATGPVKIYANDVSLAGHFGSNVTVVAAGHLTVAASTTIAGTLIYQAPESAVIPASASIGAVRYSSPSYLPPAGTSHVLAFASVGILLLARIIGALILAGLLAGLFPRLASTVSARALESSMRRILLTMLLGFAALVATPVLILLLALTFVGYGIALILLIAYGLLVTLSYTYAGILLGGIGASRFERRSSIFWRDGILGMFILSLVALVPILGLIIMLLLMTFVGGVLLTLFFKLAFPHEAGKDELLY